MKLIKSINPKQLFQIKKSRSISKSEPPSFASSSSLSSSSSDSSSCPQTKRKGHKTHRPATPTSLLPPARGASGELFLSNADSGDICFAFNLIDRDGDGKITKCELEALFSRIGTATPSEEEIAAMMREMDIDGDGCISLEEFEAISPAFGPVSDKAELRQTFEVFDADLDGKITAEELMKVFSAIGDERCTLEDCKRMIRSVDKNGDGFVCFEDFARMMEHQR